MEKPEVENFELVEGNEAIRMVPALEPHLWWFFSGVILIFGILGCFLLIRKKRVVHDPSRLRHEAYEQARAALAQVSAEDLESAIEVSFILRRYLSLSFEEPALFETHEELISRHDALSAFPDNLRREIGDFFAKLASCKYTLGDTSENFAEITVEGTALLERMHKQ